MPPRLIKSGGYQAIQSWRETFIITITDSFKLMRNQSPFQIWNLNESNPPITQFTSGYQNICLSFLTPGNHSVCVMLRQPVAFAPSKIIICAAERDSKKTWCYQSTTPRSRPCYDSSKSNRWLSFHLIHDKEHRNTEYASEFCRYPEKRAKTRKALSEIRDT